MYVSNLLSPHQNFEEKKLYEKKKGMHIIKYKSKKLRYNRNKKVIILKNLAS